MDELMQAFPPARRPELMNPLVLAYAGDAVYDLYVRQYVVSLPNQKPHQLHRTASRIVSAKAQSLALEALLPELTEEERNVVKRGRNAKSGTVPRNADLLDYRRATGLECLIGYLFYKKEYGRIAELLAKAVKTCVDHANREGS